MRSAAIILFSSFLMCVAFLLLGVTSGMVQVTGSLSWLANPATFAYHHLKLSLLPFSCLFVLYVFLIGKIRLMLRRGQTALAEMSYYDRMLNTTISTFFGVGVIWTAIGMETALMQALDGAKPTTEGALSAWGILDSLVNGGLLVALSTTVFGGACGYLLRLLKIVLIGRAWDRAVLQEREA
jgi:hypothetical protein